MVKYEKLRAAVANCTPGPHRKNASDAIVDKGNGRYEVPLCILALAGAAMGRWAGLDGGETLAMLFKERDALRAELDGKTAPAAAEDDWWGVDK